METAAGRREQHWCLVVFATCAPGKPLWARPEIALSLAGQEHRFFEAAGRYVGLFWFTGLETADGLREQIDEKLAALHLVSAAALKKEAEERQHFADFNDLSTPAAFPAGPRPVLQGE